MRRSSTEPPAAAGSVSGHGGRRRGFGALLAVDLWERFSFFGMAAILVLYLTAPADRGGMGMASQSAAAVFAAYMSLCFLAGLPGGWLADRVLGARRAVLLGGALIACGHLVLAAPARGTLYAGLLLVVAGTGLVKPALAAMVAEAGGAGRARREADFSLFYVCIQVSALIAPVVTGLLAERIAWHLGFAAAAVGMLAGLAQFSLGLRGLGSVGSRPARPVTRAEAATVRRRVALAAAVLCAVLAPPALLGALPLKAVLAALGLTTITLPFAYLRTLRRTLDREGPAPTTLGTGEGGPHDGAVPAVRGGDGGAGPASRGARGGVVPGFRGAQEGAGQAAVRSAGDSGAGSAARARLGAFAVMMAASSAFWMIFAQSGSALSLFAERDTDRELLGFEVPASWFQSLHPLFVLLAAPFVARLARRAGPGTRTPVKFAGALAAAGTSFLLMSVAASLAEDGPVGPYWLVLVYLLYSCGEIALAPAGLALAAEVAPPGSTGRFLAVNGLFGAVGVVVGGQLYRLTAVLPLSVYFLLVGGFVLAVGAAVALAAGRLERGLAAPSPQKAEDPCSTGVSAGVRGGT
ncbi:peptide MFS transporter [Streptomyces sp. NPDC096152]|uniref:peptide MFS transporter n=1 Tax=Streptomyces sp. NPDC096152 TaxID=3366078 RepID=UPI00380361EE